jgi:hypothetical protein
MYIDRFRKEEDGRAEHESGSFVHKREDHTTQIPCDSKELIWS